MPWREELSIIQPECKTLREQDLFFFNRMLDLTDVDKHSDFVAIHEEDTAVSVCRAGVGVRGR